MSTIQITAAELATVVRYLNDESVAAVLAQGADANYAASIADGWSDADILGNLDGIRVNVESILAATPHYAITRQGAAKAISSLMYNCNRSLSAETTYALDSLYLRVMDGVMWDRYLGTVNAHGGDRGLNYELKRADAIRADRAARAA